LSGGSIVEIKVEFEDLLLVFKQELHVTVGWAPLRGNSLLEIRAFSSSHARSANWKNENFVVMV
jgi:hypothetical protein